MDQNTRYCKHCGNPTTRPETKPTDMGLVVLILGIATIFMALIGANPVGIILSIIGIVLWRKSREQFQNPTYMKIGSIMCIAGLVLCAALFVYGIIVASLALSALGGVMSWVFEGLRSTMN